MIKKTTENDLYDDEVPSDEEHEEGPEVFNMAQKITFNEIYDIQEVEERLEQYSSNNWNSNMYIKHVNHISEDESENLEQTLVSDLRKETP